MSASSQPSKRVVYSDRSVEGAARHNKQRLAKKVILLTYTRLIGQLVQSKRLKTARTIRAPLNITFGLCAAWQAQNQLIEVTMVLAQ